jgi:hypothetical protein
MVGVCRTICYDIFFGHSPEIVTLGVKSEMKAITKFMAMEHGYMAAVGHEMAIEHEYMAVSHEYMAIGGREMVIEHEYMAEFT